MKDVCRNTHQQENPVSYSRVLVSHNDPQSVPRKAFPQRLAQVPDSESVCATHVGCIHVPCLHLRMLPRVGGAARQNNIVHGGGARPKLTGHFELRPTSSARHSKSDDRWSCWLRPFSRFRHSLPRWVPERWIVVQAHTLCMPWSAEIPKNRVTDRPSPPPPQFDQLRRQAPPDKANIGGSQTSGGMF